MASCTCLFTLTHLRVCTCSDDTLKDDRICTRLIGEHMCVWLIGEHMCVWLIGEHMCVWLIGEHVCVTDWWAYVCVTCLSVRRISRKTHSFVNSFQWRKRVRKCMCICICARKHVRTWILWSHPWFCLGCSHENINVWLSEGNKDCYALEDIHDYDMVSTPSVTVFILSVCPAFEAAYPSTSPNKLKILQDLLHKKRAYRMHTIHRASSYHGTEVLWVGHVFVQTWTRSRPTKWVARLQAHPTSSPRTAIPAEQFTSPSLSTSRQNMCICYCFLK